MKKGKLVLDKITGLILLLLALVILIFFIYYLKEKIIHFFEVIVDVFK